MAVVTPHSFQPVFGLAGSLKKGHGKPCGVTTLVLPRQGRTAQKRGVGLAWSAAIPSLLLFGLFLFLFGRWRKITPARQKLVQAGQPWCRGRLDMERRTPKHTSCLFLLCFPAGVRERETTAAKQWPNSIPNQIAVAVTSAHPLLSSDLLCCRGNTRLWRALP
jgi:hypothetical protein